MIVIPMAGMSSRFFNAGYKKPKYMLHAHGVTIFEHSVSSFKEYFKTETFLFIVRDVFDTPAFVEDKAKKMGIDDFFISIIDRETRGQGETVANGLEDYFLQNDVIKRSITVFNIDTFRSGFKFPSLKAGCDGYLEVFKGKGSNWSFAKPKLSTINEVEETAEKKAISNLCSTGLYYFKSSTEYLDAYYDYLAKPEEEWEKGEIYIAPLYNYLIKQGGVIKYNEINFNEVTFCGIPSEYEKFRKDAI